MFIDKALGLSQNSPQYLALKARILKALGDLSGAKAIAEKAVSLDSSVRGQLEDLLS
jgi:hypothetical protein